jgi:limonene-1,2-epoxide hydrolase
MVAALTEGRWDDFIPFFTEDLFYKVGSNPPVHGGRAAADFLIDFYKVVKPTKHVPRGAWLVDENTVIIEMDANYIRVADNKPIVVPCCDVYRFEGDLINEWRVYPDVAEVFKA